MGISENIKLLREHFELTQAELGSIAGVSDKAVSTWEAGLKTPRMGALQKIADHFNVNKSNIIENDGLDFFLSGHSALEPIDISEEEIRLIEGYRKLDSNVRKFVYESLTASERIDEAKKKYTEYIEEHKKQAPSTRSELA